MGSDPNVLDVLISGAGPTGMMAAAVLLEMGVQCRLIDKTPIRSDKSRALVVQAKTLELFQRLGFADKLVSRGRTAVQVEWYVGDRPPMLIDLSDTGVDDSPYPFLLFVSQVETELALEAHLRTKGLEVERPLELVSFAEDANGIEAQLSGKNGAMEAVRARYLIGADGAHSAVRKGAGLKFEGAPYEQNFVLADTQIEWDAPDGVLRLFLNEHGVLVVFPMAGERRYRIIAAEGAGKAPEGDPSLEETQALVSKLSTVKTRLHHPNWLARFHLHHRGVDHYRRGRAFVAGDAAHIHSPAGGQGMNTGLQDSMNLGWKLGMVVRGLAKEKLLDSYESERLPVGKNLLRFTDRLFSLAASRNQWVVRLRDFVLPHLVPLMTGNRNRRTDIFRFISQLGINYRGGEIVSSRESGFSRGPRPGTRAPDGPVLLENGQSSTLFEELAKTSSLKHSLVLFGEPDANSLQALQALRPQLLEVLRGGETPLLRERYGVTTSAVYLIRPDGYVAFRSPTFDANAIDQFLLRVY